MANVLGELFSDIADAIRGKTGETGTMKPAEFPDKIAGIEAGGGGSFSAGLYWKSLGIRCQNKYYQQWFEYNGELYAITNQTSGAAAIKYIYKWSGTSWTQVVNLSTGLIFANAHGATLVEYNGVIHLSGGESNAHYVFNGTTLTAKNNLPNKIATMGMFVQNGLLKAYSYYDGIVYVWDEASDTWTAEATIGSKYNYYNFFTIGGVVYAIYSNKVYIYADGAATQCGTTTSFSTPAVVYDGCLYYKDSYNMKLYRYDPATSAAAVVGTMPVSGTNSPLFVYNGELCYLPYSESEYFSGMVMYEVQETSQTLQ